MAINLMIFIFIVPLKRFLVLGTLLVMDAIYWRFPFWSSFSLLLLSFPSLAQVKTSNSFLEDFSLRGAGDEGIYSVAYPLGSYTLFYSPDHPFGRHLRYTQ